MPDDEVKEQPEVPRAKPRRGWRRNSMMAAVIIAAVVLLVVLAAVLFYKTGGAESYVRAQFTARMAEMGIVFNTEAFRLTASPLELHLTNASFNDRLTGERLFFIREAHITMTVQDLYALNLRRDISIDTTEITGAEVWIRFDENGRSNFSNLKFVEEEEGARVNFRYESVKFSVRESIVHFGDLSRRISGDANNLVFLLTPEPGTDRQRYRFDLSSTDSTFAYEDRGVEKIDIRAVGIADDLGAEVTQFDVRTPIGEAFLTGTITDWADPRYAFDVRSTFDLTQGVAVFSPGTAVSGVGNFAGKISGQGENYRIEGEADSQALRAEGVYLKAVNVAATLTRTNSNYEAQGTAIAELLTFEDFRIDLLRLTGNVRGNGTDFTWLGELQAAAARTRSLTLGGLFLADARAEKKDNEIRAQAVSGRAQRFSAGDLEFADLATRDLRFQTDGDRVNLSAATAQARTLGTRDFRLEGAAGRNLRVRNRQGLTEVDLDGVRSASGNVGGNRLRGVSADTLSITDRSASTSLTARNLRAERVDGQAGRVDGIEAPLVTAEDTASGLVIHSDTLRVARVENDSAVLGSLNIGGVRLTIRRGRVEARSNDIDAGTVALKRTSALPEGGRLEGVTAARPVYILEPSGRYRVTADMSLGGGTVGSIALGAARAQVVATNDSVSLNELTAAVMEGELKGSATIALNNRALSQLTGDFTDLDIGKLIALQSGRVVPLEGQTTGTIDLSFTGTNFRNADGRINASIDAAAGTADRGLVPVDGDIRLTATNGLFTVEQGDLRSQNSTLNARGQIDLRTDNSDLTVALRSTDAGEIDRLVRVLGVLPDLEQQLDSLQAQASGNLAFDGTIKGNFYDPTIEGKASVDSITMRGEHLGSVTTDVFVSPVGVELRNGRLAQRGGGTAEFAVNIPYGGVNNTSVTATVTNVDAGSLLAALPIELPERIRDLDGRTSGTVNITGLPNNAQGSIDLRAASGVVAGQAFDNLVVKAVFQGTLVRLETAEMQLGAGRLSATGTYDRVSTDFNLDITGRSVPVPLVLALLPPNNALPAITGTADLTAKATGTGDRPSTYNINFEAVAPNVVVAETALGQVTIKGTTTNQTLTADLTAILDGRPQVVNATVNFGSDDMPFSASTVFDQSPIEPFLAFIPQLKQYGIRGTGTGRVDFGGNLRGLDPQGNRVFTAANLSGTAEFSQLALQVQETPLAAAEPILIRFNPREIVFERARFSGGGSNMTIAGTKALTDAGTNDLSIEGRVNLTLMNLFTTDTFFAGLADASVRVTGPNAEPRISGTANFVNASIATFLGADRFQADRVEARVIFTSNQFEVESARGFLGGGRFTGSGGGVLDGLAIQAFRFSLNGNNVTVPLPTDFVTTGDAQLEFTGVRPARGDRLELEISGRVFARRSLYTKDIDLANVVGGRRPPQLSGGGALVAPPRFDLVIEGRDALVVRNNIADLTASVSLQLTGDADNPRLSGRITATSGTILFRRDRYEVQRGVLEFPPDTAIDPVINLQAESEIAGYQVFVNLSGPLRDSDQLSATVRSSPALPQADVVSLITTGSLSNTAGGIPTLAQTGINTVAEVLTDTIINDPARRATDRLFGLNVFELDPIISGQTLTPSARLTVGRQINNNLRVTYATNLSQDQNQVLAVEYRVSNRLSFVAQYEQRSLTNVTRNRDTFSFEIRFRKRF